MSVIQPGEEAPGFELPDQDCNPVSLSDLRGGKVVVYFYPKVDTPVQTGRTSLARLRIAA